MKQRLSVYENSTAPLIDYYKASGVLYDIDGDKSMDEVHDEIVSVLEKASK